MKSRISFFNPGVVKKDLTRFAPLWGLYTVFMVLFVILVADTQMSGAYFANEAEYILSAMGFVNLVYGGICAMVLFGDLYNTRLCYSLHGFPMRREGWFLTHLASGMVMCLGPALVGVLVASIYLKSYFYLALIWLLVMALQFILYFGIGVFSAMCAGNRLGMGAIYGLINFLPNILAWVIRTFYEPVLYGMTLDLAWLERLSAPGGTCGREYIRTELSKIGSCTIFEGFITEDWVYLVAAAVAGILLMVAAVALYRKRKLETAGDFVAFRAVGNVFLILYSLCFGTLMHYIADQDYNLLFIVAGLAIGFFTGRMLLEKKVNVFRLRNLVTFGLLVAAFGISVGLTWLDPLGVTRYVPPADQVEKVYASPYAHDIELALTSAEDIEAIRSIHKTCVSRRDNGSHRVYLRYKLKNGATLERTYYLEGGTEAAEVLKGYYSSEAYVLGALADPENLPTLLKVTFYNHTEDYPFMVFSSPLEKTDEEELYEMYGRDANVVFVKADGGLEEAPPILELLDAIRADCKAGKMAQQPGYHNETEDKFGYVGEIAFEYFTQDENGSVVYSRTMDIMVYWDCENTLRWLKQTAAGAVKE